MNEGWPKTKLKDLVDANRKITYGIVVPGPEEKNGIPMIRAQDYSKGWVPLEQVYKVGKKVDESYRRSKVKAGDILLTIVGSVGNLAKVPDYLEGANLTQQTARLAFDSSSAIPEFYFNYLKSSLGKREIYKFTKSGVQPSLNLGDVEKFIVPLPPLAEQRKIAEILSTWDRAIELLKEYIAKQEDLFKGLLLFTFSPENDHSNGKWDSINVGSLADFQNGNSFKSSEWSESGQPIIRIQNLNGSREFNYFSGSLDKKFWVNKGDLLFSWSGSRGTSFGPFLWDYCDGWLNQHIFRVSSKGAFDHLFLYFLLLYVTRQLEYKAHGSAGLVHVTKNELTKFKVLVPSDKQTRLFASSLLKTKWEQIELLRELHNNFSNQKRGLMQQLLTGKTRVKV